MKRAIIIIVNDIMNENYSSELNPEYTYVIKYVDGEWMASKTMQEPERKKGRWEDFSDDNSYRCTACGEIWKLNDGKPEENNMNYCPNCGADMRGDEE